MILKNFQKEIEKSLMRRLVFLDETGPRGTVGPGLRGVGEGGAFMPKPLPDMDRINAGDDDIEIFSNMETNLIAKNEIKENQISDAFDDLYALADHLEWTFKGGRRDYASNRIYLTINKVLRNKALSRVITSRIIRNVTPFTSLSKLSRGDTVKVDLQRKTVTVLRAHPTEENPATVTVRNIFAKNMESATAKIGGSDEAKRAEMANSLSEDLSTEQKMEVLQRHNAPYRMYINVGYTEENFWENYNNHIKHLAANPSNLSKPLQNVLKNRRFTKNDIRQYSTRKEIAVAKAMQEILKTVVDGGATTPEAVDAAIFGKVIEEAPEEEAPIDEEPLELPNLDNLDDLPPLDLPPLDDVPIIPLEETEAEKAERERKAREEATRQEEAQAEPEDQAQPNTNERPADAQPPNTQAQRRQQRQEEREQAEREVDEQEPERRGAHENLANIPRSWIGEYNIIKSNYINLLKPPLKRLIEGRKRLRPHATTNIEININRTALQIITKAYRVGEAYYKGNDATEALNELQELTKTANTKFAASNSSPIFNPNFPNKEQALKIYEHLRSDGEFAPPEVTVGKTRNENGEWVDITVRPGNPENHREIVKNITVASFTNEFIKDLNNNLNSNWKQLIYEAYSESGRTAPRASKLIEIQTILGNKINAIAKAEYDFAKALLYENTEEIEQTKVTLGIAIFAANSYAANKSRGERIPEANRVIFPNKNISTMLDNEEYREKLLTRYRKLQERTLSHEGVTERNQSIEDVLNLTEAAE
jgi:hypothetical protein